MARSERSVALRAATDVPQRGRHPEGLVLRGGMVGEDRLQPHDALVNLREFDVVIRLLGEVLQGEDRRANEVQLPSRVIGRDRPRRRVRVRVPGPPPGGSRPVIAPCSPLLDCQYLPRTAPQALCPYVRQNGRTPVSGGFVGADDGTRTHDLLHGKPVRPSVETHRDQWGRIPPEVLSSGTHQGSSGGVMASHHLLTNRRR